ncbi:MAG TPA: zinc ribbon domain-containing protein [bacterium]|nr:zinc ribbon domain-containing protein [bacterium]
MPIYEYICNNCKNEFDLLIYGNENAQCPKCESSNLSKKFSVFAVGGANNSMSCADTCASANYCPSAAAGGELPGCCPGCHS